jgi:hypothetical protein
MYAAKNPAKPYVAYDFPITKILQAPAAQPKNFTPIKIISMHPLIVTLYNDSERLRVQVEPGQHLTITKNTIINEFSVESVAHPSTELTHLYCLLEFKPKDQSYYKKIRHYFTALDFHPSLSPTETIRIDHTEGELNNFKYQIITTLLFKAGKHNQLAHLMIPKDRSKTKYHYYVPGAIYLKAYRFVYAIMAKVKIGNQQRKIETKNQQ